MGCRTIHPAQRPARAIDIRLATVHSLHMLGSLRAPVGTRWPRGQKFSLSSRGTEALATFKEAIRDAHATPGRAALEATQRAWAGPLGIQPSDGIVLSELTIGRRSLTDVARALDSCGVSTAEVKASVDRLVVAGMVDAVPLPSQVGP